jgi:hypothetical protein
MWVWLWVGAAFWACGASSGKPERCLTGDAITQIGRVEEVYCIPMAQMLCAYAQECGCSESFFWQDTRACEAAWRERCRASLENLRSAFDEGRLLFCPDAVGACLDAYRPVLANCLRGMPQGNRPLACVQMFSEPVSMGANCCQGGHGCNGAEG